MLHPRIQPTEPIVKIRNTFSEPYADAIAAARTCYSQNAVEAADVTDQQKNNIGRLTFNAGHHTVYQHATYEFTLENVSRHMIWSVLHSFPFYNSDQQSQRYVRLKQIRAFLPSMPESAMPLYQEALVDAYDTYVKLGEILKVDTLSHLRKLRHVDRHPLERLEKKVRRDADKKAIEIARYVLPVATHASLVYTVSGLVLHRLYRLSKSGDCPSESSKVIELMVQEAKRVDPEFFDKIGDPPRSFDDLPETPFLEDQPSAGADFAAWDRKLGGFHHAKLLDCNRDPQTLLAESIALALGQNVDSRSTQAWIDLALDPRQNPLRLEKTNLSTHAPTMRALHHVNYTFLKRLSHSADSQNQRHRMVPGSRPIFQLADGHAPDYFVPILIRQNQEALDVYSSHMEKVWKTKAELLNLGVSREHAVYILPNAVNVRFVETGSLMHLTHKWTQRTCLNAQEEIFNASMEEMQQVFDAHPFLERYMGPPCVIRNGVVKPRCTEGDHFCGVDVWNRFPNIERVL